MAIWVLSNRLRRSALARSSSSTLALSSRLTVLQLLVDRLQLLLAGLQLLVGRLQLLVDRDQLLVGGFQLLERGLVFLDRRLQPLAGVAQLVLELRTAARRPRPARRLRAASSTVSGGPRSANSTRNSGSAVAVAGSGSTVRLDRLHAPPRSRPRRRARTTARRVSTASCRAARRSSRKPLARHAPGAAGSACPAAASRYLPVRGE